MHRFSISRSFWSISRSSSELRSAGSAVSPSSQAPWRTAEMASRTAPPF
ncbi:MAG: hypothetical protein ACLSHO_14230 [Dysosmobacter sp.]